MIKKVVLVLVAVLALFLGYVSTRSGHFRYERSGLIAASPEKIYPYLSNLRMGEQWSPYEKKDPAMKKTFAGADGQVGSTLAFEGNPSSGSGILEILNLVPNQKAELKLTMLKPFHGENFIEYRLTPEAGGTRFTWTMSGEGGFISKLVSVFIDCEKLVAGDFEVGIANVKALAEAKQ